MWICRRSQKAKHSAARGSSGQLEGHQGAYVFGAGINDRKVEGSATGESFDMGTVAATSGAPYLYTGDTYPLVQPKGPVEMGDTGITAELSAGEDGVFRTKKG